MHIRGFFAYNVARADRCYIKSRVYCESGRCMGWWPGPGHAVARSRNRATSRIGGSPKRRL
jgi:hypothetical protein